MSIIRESLALMAASVLLTSHALAAEKMVALSDLARRNGTWKSEFKDAEGHERIAYTWNRTAPTNAFQSSVFFTADKATKKVVDMFFGYSTVAPGGQELQGLYFSSGGWVARTTTVPMDKGFVTHADVMGTNRSSFHVTFHQEFQSDTAYTETWKDLVGGGKFTEQGPVRRFQKVDKTVRELIDGGDLVFERVTTPIKPLEPLSRLIGRWRVVDSDGKTTHSLNWRLSGQGRWLVERWQIGTEQGGINVSGVDPANGTVALWSINGDFMDVSGRWDAISDTVLGQVQGENRLIREFPDKDTFKAHWQTRRAGSFVDVPADQGGTYTAKRLPQNN